MLCHPGSFLLCSKAYSSLLLMIGNSFQKWNTAFFSKGCRNDNENHDLANSTVYFCPIAYHRHLAASGGSSTLNVELRVIKFDSIGHNSRWQYVCDMTMQWLGLELTSSLPRQPTNPPTGSEVGVGDTAKCGFSPIPSNAMSLVLHCQAGDLPGWAWRRLV